MSKMFGFLYISFKSPSDECAGTPINMDPLYVKKDAVWMATHCVAYLYKEYRLGTRMNRHIQAILNGIKDLWNMRMKITINFHLKNAIFIQP